MKYIDSEELIAEIKRRMKDYNASIEKYYNKQKPIKAERDSWKWAECKWFLNLINSLQQEQPSLPSNLDEAAETAKELAYKTWSEGENWSDAAIKTFKAAAKWMAGQGVTKEVVIGMATEEISINVSKQTLDELDLCPGDKVVVQIRKEDIVI